MIPVLVAKRGVRAAFDMLNRRDLDGFLARWHDDATFILPGDVAASGVYRGKDLIRVWFDGFLEQLPQIRFTVKHVAAARMFDILGDNVFYAHWDIDLVNRDGFTAKNAGVTVVTTRRGKVINAEDIVFDTGATFRAYWGEASLPVHHDDAGPGTSDSRVRWQVATDLGKSGKWQR
jgi:ketosteroid isomerase-like protein